MFDTLSDRLTGVFDRLRGRGALNEGDVREARASNKELATQIAHFHELRARPRSPVLTASLTPSLPKLLSGPRPVTDRSSL